MACGKGGRLIEGGDFCYEKRAGLFSFFYIDYFLLLVVDLFLFLLPVGNKIAS